MASKKHTPADALKVVVETLQELETNEKQWVLQSAASLWSVSVQALTPSLRASPLAGGASGNGSHVPPAVGDVANAKAFMKAKDPKSDLQRVAVLAYHLTNGKATPTFKTRQITAANTEAKGPKFNTTRAIENASRTPVGYLSSIGKGEKQITAHGEEIVEALPDQEAVKAIEAKYKQGKRGGGGRKKHKKKA